MVRRVDVSAAWLILEASERTLLRDRLVAVGVARRDHAVRACGLVRFAKPAAADRFIAPMRAVDLVVTSAELIAGVGAVAAALAELTSGARDRDARAGLATDRAVEIAVREVGVDARALRARGRGVLRRASRRRHRTQSQTEIETPATPPSHVP